YRDPTGDALQLDALADARVVADPDVRLAADRLVEHRLAEPLGAVQANADSRKAAGEQPARHENSRRDAAEAELQRPDVVELRVASHAAERGRDGGDVADQPARDVDDVRSVLEECACGRARGIALPVHRPPA